MSCHVMAPSPPRSYFINQLRVISPFRRYSLKHGFFRHRTAFAGTRWHDGVLCLLAHLREQGHLGPTVPHPVAYTVTNKRVFEPTMKVIVKQWHAIAQWQWDTGKADENGEPEEDVCGICRVPFEGCCPTCKVPGDDCPLSRSLLM
jgi:hypothetical protein